MEKITKKKPISITVKGKSVCRMYGNATEVQTFISSLNDKNEQVVASLLNGDEAINLDHIPSSPTVTHDMAQTPGEYEDNLGNWCRELQKSLASSDDDDDAGGNPPLSAVES